MSERLDWTLAAPCSKCGETSGYVEPSGPNMVGRCSNDHYVKNVSKAELGMKPRSISRSAISPKRRFSILVRDGHTCWTCGTTAPYAQLHVDHIIPMDAAEHGPAELLNSDMNLWTCCEECNLGKGKWMTPLFVRHIVWLYHATANRQEAA